ncbi:hypothetical protein [Paenibacillus sp. NRS-1760]|uniref:hypothetical protein n=1 Tax=Paenibacillus sp. NRS-1760 TaxID=3233902 RepID=UPI003D2E1B55
MLLVGLIGGILGILLCIILFFGGLMTIFAGNEQVMLFVGALVVLITSIIGIVAGVSAEKKTKYSTILFFVSGGINLIAGLFSTYAIILIGVVFLFGGILGVFKLEKKSNSAAL